MTALRWIWRSDNYWPIWLSLFIGLFLLREIIALATNRTVDTLSDWTWNILMVKPDQPLIDWRAVHFLVFGVWNVMFIWLTFHFFFRDFT